MKTVTEDRLINEQAPLTPYNYADNFTWHDVPDPTPNAQNRPGGDEYRVTAQDTAEMPAVRPEPLQTFRMPRSAYYFGLLVAGAAVGASYAVAVALLERWVTAS